MAPYGERTPSTTRRPPNVRCSRRALFGGSRRLRRRCLLEALAAELGR